jgi:phospholipid/cholesterol/gamma-HCH transport system permease protein
MRAMSVAMPMLATYANVVAICGGFFVAFLYLGLGANIYFPQVWRALTAKDVLLGVVKSVCFGWIIVLSAARAGLLAKGGAQAVGHATTRAVVRSIFWIIVADAAFSMAFYFA